MYIINGYKALKAKIICLDRYNSGANPKKFAHFYNYENRVRSFNLVDFS